MSRLGEQVRKLRLSKGITEKQLGKQVGVSEKFIEEVEWGKRVLNDDLIKRISKVLGQEISDLMIVPVGKEEPEPEKSFKPVLKPEKKEVQEVWNDALDSVLKSIPIYEYDLVKVTGTRQLPVIANKVEGYTKDKICYIQIMDNDMIGFRILKGDIAFAHITHEIENNAICLVEYNGKRAIRQLKRLEGDKILLISNKGTLSAETLHFKEIKVLARLVRLEIKL